MSGNRPVYPVILIDAIMLKVRDGQVANRPAYVAMGITVDGERDVLGMWLGPPGGEGAKHWLSMLTELRNRGIADVCIVSCDGLKGLPEAINATWPQAVVQTCVVHLVRNSLRYASKKHWAAITRDLKPVYTAPTVEAAEARFAEFAETWRPTYPALVAMWERSWAEFVPFLDFRACRRMRVVESMLWAWLGSWCMAKSYRPVLRDQPMLLPVDLREWLPPDHLVWFVLETVEALDTSALERTRRRGGVGAAGYDPRMLLGLLVYAYCQGVRSSRRIERMCVTDVAFRVLCAQDGPDHATIARFRAEAGEVFVGLFSQVLLVAANAGLGHFGTVAIDGTKIAANASIDANRGKEWFDRQVTDLVTDAQRVDQAEDTAADTGPGEERSDRVPADLGERTERMARIRAAARELAAQQQRRSRVEERAQAAALARRRRSEQGQPVVGRIPNGPHRLGEARAHLARETAIHQAKLDRYAALVEAGKKPMGRPPVPMHESSRVTRAQRVLAKAEAEVAAAEQSAPPGSVVPKTVANTTDPQSRIMPTRRGFVQGYNAQVAVTSDQLIVAVQVGQSPNDQRCFTPMMRAAQDAATRLHAHTGNTDQRPGHGAGRRRLQQRRQPPRQRPRPADRARQGPRPGRAAAKEPAQGPPPADATPRQANAHRLRTPEGRDLYKRRAATVEPGIGNLKKIIDRFSRRGLGNATSELHLAATAFNIMKIHRAAPAT